MLAGIREILIIVSPVEIVKFKGLLGYGEHFGLSISYVNQEHPEGLAQSMILAEEFLGGDSSCLILGDNIFHGAGLGRALANYSSVKGAHIFGYQVKTQSLMA
jgi:glucose-1-phosphate thymidylyltransferase